MREGSGPVSSQVDTSLMNIRKANFPDDITFYTPGFRRFKTSEYNAQIVKDFVSISVTGKSCALNCEHCNTNSLRGMIDLPQTGGSLFDLCARLSSEGTRGVLVSGGSDRQGRVPLAKHIPDLIRVRKEIGMTIRVHPGLPDEETCDGISEIGVDGVMLDIVGDVGTIRDVYHLDYSPDEYESVLERLEKHAIPTYPHILLGHYFGRMRGEWHALQMIQRHERKALVVIVLNTLRGTSMFDAELPKIVEIERFFHAARLALPTTPIILGCARPGGPEKLLIDRAAIASGFNALAYPAEGIVELAKEQGLKTRFVDACCGVNW